MAAIFASIAAAVATLGERKEEKKNGNTN